MNNRYKHYAYEQITKELLDSIKVGDELMINGWRDSLNVVGVSANYFVMCRKLSVGYNYSVCEKKLCEYDHNGMLKDRFHVGTDGWLSYAPTWFKYSNKDTPYSEIVNFENKEATQEYIESFELENSADRSFISPRNSVPLFKIKIKHHEEV